MIAMPPTAHSSSNDRADPADPEHPEHTEDPAIAATRAWVERAVIGLGLCPFAKASQLSERIRYVQATVHDAEGLIEALAAELERIALVRPEDIETTLLIHPHVLEDFLDYNDFLDVADALVEQMGLEGVIQVASFHPRYQFEGTAADDIENYTNRAPYPTLHLLREDSVERAVETHPDIESIPVRNIATLKSLGLDGWKALDVGPADDHR